MYDLIGDIHGHADELSCLTDPEPERDLQLCTDQSLGLGPPLPAACGRQLVDIGIPLVRQ